MRVFVLIPWCETPDRLPGYKWVREYYESMGYTVITQTDNNVPFRRSWAINQAFRKTVGIKNKDVLILADADIVVAKKHLQTAVKTAYTSRKLVIPHNSVCRMTKDQSLDVTNNHSPRIGPKDHWWSNVRTKAACSGLIVLRVDSFMKVNGFDENFIGWGGEDNVFRTACDGILGKHSRLPAPMFHFWHEVDPKRAKTTHYDKNKARYHQYNDTTSLKMAFEPASGNLLLDDYGLKKGYISRNSSYFDDTTNTDNYQDNVYYWAKGKFGRISSILDVGCGSGFKLVKYFADLKTIGVDLQKTVEYCKTAYPERDWRTETEVESVDAVICSDVIEHIDDPAFFLDKLNDLNWKHLVISTVERDICRGKNDMGPPKNRYHCREWNKKEFDMFTGKHIGHLNREIKVLGKHNLVIHFQR